MCFNWREGASQPLARSDRCRSCHMFYVFQNRLPTQRTLTAPFLFWRRRFSAERAISLAEAIFRRMCVLCKMFTVISLAASFIFVLLCTQVLDLLSVLELGSLRVVGLLLLAHNAMHSPTCYILVNCICSVWQQCGYVIRYQGLCTCSLIIHLS